VQWNIHLVFTHDTKTFGCSTTCMNMWKHDLEICRCHPITHIWIFTPCAPIHISPNNRRDKSLWDLPPCPHTASHTVPIRLSLDTQRSKNNTAALKKPPGGKQTRQSEALLFISNGDTSRSQQGSFATNPLGLNMSIDAMIDSLADKNRKWIYTA